MTYARVENGKVVEYPIYPGDIALRFPNTSFPVPFEPPDGYQPVRPTPQPAVDHTQALVEAEPLWTEEGLVQAWQVIDADPEQVAERTLSQAAAVRQKRDQLLNASDWTQLGDAPVEAAAWITYRQQLREVPSQEGFPWEVTWPAPPSTTN